MAETRPVVPYDHHSPTYAEDPAGKLAALRATCPVAWSESFGGFWVLTRYADVDRVLRDPSGFSSRHDEDPASPYQGAAIPAPPMRFVPLELDPPHFLPYRRLLNPVFSPAAVEAMRGRVETYTDWCIDRVIDSGHLDFVEDLATPVPAMTTLDILGLPVQDWPIHAAAWHGTVANPPGSPRHVEAVAAAMAIRESLAAEVERRRASPDRLRHGLLDVCLDAEIDGRPIPDAMLIDIFVLVLAGGVDTTTSATSGAFAYLGQHPEVRRRLIAEPDLLPAACEELLRWVTPSPSIARTSNCAAVIGEQTIGQHERVMVNLFAANRDPAAFDRPDEVDLDRPDHRHAAFGLGIHRCIGANVARLEMQTMIGRALRRMPDFTVEADEVQRYHTAGIQNGLFAVPARFSPGATAGASL
jgi:cytochrome P450